MANTLKAPPIKKKYTQQQLDEVFKCHDDPIYFIKKWLKIQHPIKGRIPFDLYPFQEDCIKDFLAFKNNIILKSRQLGLSTVTAAYCLWFALFRRDANILIMATKLEVGKLMIRKIRTAFQMLPSWMLGILDIADPESESVRYLALTNGSRITAIPTAQDAGRGEAVSLLVVDEAAHVTDLKELWLGLKPTLSTGGRAIIFSTPAGTSNFFYELWKGAEVNEFLSDRSGQHATKSGKNGFHTVKLPWTVHPERDEAWFEQETKSMDQRGINQELLCSFEASGNTFIEPATIEFYQSIIREPILKHSTNMETLSEDYWIWVTPEHGHDYLICADVARGDADDFSAFHVINMNTSEAVAEFYGKITTDEFGQFLNQIGRQYHNALIVQEKNTYGVAVANTLKMLQYPNLWYDPALKEKMEFMTPDEKAKQIPGFMVSPKNREELLRNFEEVLRMHRIKINSSRFVEELGHFIWNGNKVAASKKKHDDLIMSLAIGLQVFNPQAQNLMQTSESSAFAMAFLKSISKSARTMTTGISTYGMNPEAPNQRVGQNNKFLGKQLPVGVRRETVEMDWLIRREFDWLLK